MVYELSKPTSQRTTRITTIVSSMLFYSFQVIFLSLLEMVGGKLNIFQFDGCGAERPAAEQFSLIHENQK
jgi:hypothetical protein